MGECAEMVLDGYLDWDGSYSGERERKNKLQNNAANYNKVYSLFRAWSITPVKRWDIVYSYGQKLISERGLTAEQRINFIDEAANNWTEFKSFVKQSLNP